MTNLFIIGNGFDLAHGLLTSFGDFRAYLHTLTSERLLSYYNAEGPLNIKEGQDGEEYIAIEDVIAFTIHLYDSLCSPHPLWSDLEENTANIDFTQWLNDHDLGYRDKEGDINPWATEENFKLQAKSLSLVIPTLPILINHWIHTISLTNILPKETLKKLMDKENNLFFSFNYTLTLEDVYNISSEQICHIHGKCDNTNFGTLPHRFLAHEIPNYHIKVGHNKTFNFKFDRDFHYHEISEIVNDMANSLNKNIASNITNNQIFFSKLKKLDVRHIYSYGFSYSSVDQDYIKEIIKNIDTLNSIWHFNNYDIIHNPMYQKKLKNYGYMGQIAPEPFIME